MDRIRRFQRSLITILVGINTFVFCFSNDLSITKSLAYALSGMLSALLMILIYIAFKKRFEAKRVSGK